MNKSHFIKAILLAVLVIGVETGNASFNHKCCKAAKQSKSIISNKAATALHFMPLDVVKW